MNYLAHFHLASADDDWLVGALLGDFVKGPLRGDWPAGWEKGIRLHRRIDALSDQHPLRAELAAALPPDWRRYTGIVLDVCCDHWLSRDWTRWHDAPLPVFAERVYAVLADVESGLPAPAQRFAGRLRDYDMLNGYRDVAAVPATLQRIGARLRHDNPLRHAGAECTAVAARLHDGFEDFYGDLQRRLAADVISQR
ncbi:Acyl carrier protein phosphodiesterase, putative [Ricinus communis]|uniref:Acyl carrier protein phosphodiesterase, putative n=1 Tax=Ricinus communis TaxID=3988 RepID=B9TQI8_RICCO|nr:Acyl carrier protein phosphodiesterase, putative [Ricinus communis]